jgi:hypothetical protein
MVSFEAEIHGLIPVISSRNAIMELAIEIKGSLFGIEKFSTGQISVEIFPCITVRLSICGGRVTHS